MQIAYGFQYAWCESLRIPLGDVTATPPPESGVPMVANLRIEGSLRVGTTLHARDDFAHAGGATEGASLYQWSLVDVATGKATPINGAKQRSYTLTGKDQGQHRVLFKIERLVASNGDVAPTQYSTTTQESTVTGAQPEARDLRIVATPLQAWTLDAPPVVGQRLKAEHDPHDPDGDVFGGSTHQWCEYPADSDTAHGCTAWSTSDTHLVTGDSIGKRIAVKLIPRTATGTPNVGAEVTSAMTAAVIGATGPALTDGAYHIRFARMDVPNAPVDQGCLSAEGNGTGTVASINAAGPAPLSCTVPDGSTKAMWDVHSVTSTAGQVAYVIKSRTNNRCLIRGINGTAANASLYVWGGGDARFCGFATADAFIANGQAAWDLDGLHQVAAAGRAYHAGAIRLRKPTQAFLGLTNGAATFSNDANVVAQWQLAFHPVVTATAPEARNLRIEGEVKVGNMVKAAFDPFDAQNDPFGGTTYQWCQYAPNSDTPETCSAWRTSDGWIVTVESVGKRLAVNVIPRTTTGTPNVGAEVTSAKTIVVPGHAPEARHLRIEGEAQVGAVLKAVFYAFDVESDPFGGTTYQWCQYPANSDTPESCSAWTTSDSWTVLASNIGKRLAVNVIPRTTSGTPNVGEEVTSPKTAVVIGTPPEARNLRIEGQASQGQTLKAAFDPFDAQNDPFGGTTYQWCQYAANSDTLEGCAAWSTSDSWTVLASNVGKRLAVKVIPRTTSGTPNVGAEVTSAKTAVVVTGTKPEARNLRIEGVAQVGAVMRAVFEAFDAENDPFGSTVYQWCWYPVTGENCSPWSTSATYQVQPGNLGTRVAVKVIPKTTTGTPNEGAQVTSAQTAVVAAWVPPVYRNEQRLDIPATGAWVESKIYVADSGQISDQRLNVRILDLDIRDLVVKLIAPNGVETIVHNREGTFKDGSLVREYEMTRVTHDQRGWWTLRMQAPASWHYGYLASWSLSFRAPWHVAGLPPPPLDGLYRIRFNRLDASGAATDHGCLSAEGNGTGNDCTEPNNSTKARWFVYPVTASTGQVAYVIRTRTDNRCLIRGNNGTATTPSLLLWGTVADPRFCGFPTADALIANGQAAWDLSGLQPITEFERAYHRGPVRLIPAGTPCTERLSGTDVQQRSRRRCTVAVGVPQDAVLRWNGSRAGSWPARLHSCRQRAASSMRCNAHAMDHRPFDTRLGDLRRHAAQRRYPRARRCAALRGFAATSAVLRRCDGDRVAGGGHRLHTDARPRRTSHAVEEFTEHTVAQCEFPRVCRLHGHSRISKRARCPCRTRARNTHRGDVRRSDVVAMPPWADLGRLQGRRLGGHPPRLARPQRGTSVHRRGIARRRPAHIRRTVDGLAVLTHSRAIFSRIGIRPGQPPASARYNATTLTALRVRARRTHPAPATACARRRALRTDPPRRLRNARGQGARRSRCPCAACSRCPSSTRARFWRMSAFSVSSSASSTVCR